MTDFSSLGLAEPVLRAVLAAGYENPTPIQEQGIPPLMENRDVLGIAQTGTGKTAAFVLPLLHKIANSPVTITPKSSSVLILAPTRELVAQIAESIRVYGRFIKPTVAVIVGGVNPRPQARTMAGGVNIVVATPGRLLDHMSTGAVKLDSVRTIVLDEADQMMDLGFMPAIRRIMQRVPSDRQTVLFSATMPSAIRALANDFLNEPVNIAVAAESRPIERISQTVEHMPADRKKDRLIAVLSSTDVERAIVFTRTKHGADKVTKYLDSYGLKAAAIHGNKSQGARTRALDQFKKSEIRILVATDIAARGIDIDDVSHVVNFELPNIPESYVHRIGRTARAGKSGVAISFCDGSEFGYLKDIERAIKMRIDAVGEPEPATGPAVKRRGGGGGGRGRPQGGEGRDTRSQSRGPKSDRGDRNNRRAPARGDRFERDEAPAPRSSWVPNDNPDGDRPVRPANAPTGAKPKRFDRDRARENMIGETSETRARGDRGPRRDDDRPAYRGDKPRRDGAAGKPQGGRPAHAKDGQAKRGDKPAGARRTAEGKGGNAGRRPRPSRNAANG
ncbi:DEAD/DEAH box helicase [Parvularcula sp. LCG005]|uniref:DEAD/DEAH box helicase n=1 Tax=Parvularcula sp. LCG005 TaxID=3078805 RepID=UPI0029432D19|nr:DEAD/DEAH box helicase [Parvularcula sp. LCG005]WOI53369.1 DEAD/DEAH box helicase [Parvularcula sp. LCG005]